MSRGSRNTAGVAGFTRLPSRLLVTLILIGICASMAYPLYLTLVTSVKTLHDYQGNYIGIPKEWTGSAYARAWTRSHVSHYAWNSVKVTAMSLILLLITVVPAGFAFAKLRFPFRRVILSTVIGLVIIAPALQIIPVIKIATAYHLMDSHLGLALVQVTFSLSFGIYLMSAYFESVPSTIFEAATIDGAGAFGTFWRIALPIAKPGVLTLLTFGFLSYWNEYIYAFIMLPTPDNRTLPVGIAGLTGGEFYQDQPLITAGVVITMVPCVLMFLLLQRNLNEGLTAGVTK
jgi:ABC-type glycerol-3-phosphate transport system permease component